MWRTLLRRNQGVRSLHGHNLQRLHELSWRKIVLQCHHRLGVQGLHRCQCLRLCQYHDGVRGLRWRQRVLRSGIPGIRRRRHRGLRRTGGLQLRGRIRLHRIHPKLVLRNRGLCLRRGRPFVRRRGRLHRNHPRIVHRRTGVQLGGVRLRQHHRRHPLQLQERRPRVSLRRGVRRRHWHHRKLLPPKGSLRSRRSLSEIGSGMRKPDRRNPRLVRRDRRLQHRRVLRGVHRRGAERLQ
mmetsp:Transcript_15002/g.25640  ORF Transcript_15002/g.25640 Transcript_15002/m.25640 type:complete len:238 (-) Transcript_15002:634-1347(-)